MYQGQIKALQQRTEDLVIEFGIIKNNWPVLAVKLVEKLRNEMEKLEFYDNKTKDNSGIE